MDKKIIAAKLSGNTTTYFYTARAEQLVNRSAGDKVVIPNKLKEDGTLSLSIATFEGTAEVGSIDEGSLKPIVQFIDATELRGVLLALATAEART